MNFNRNTLKCKVDFLFQYYDSNGTKKKNIRSTYGEFQVEVPQDRNSSFDPKVVKKR